MHRERPQLSDDEHQLVSLDPRDVEDLRRLMAKLDPAIRLAVLGEATWQADNDSSQLVQHAQKLLDNRRRRLGIFGSQMFAEPAWEMILILYVDDAGRRHTQASLCELSGASRSTSMRWIDYLLDQDLVSREEHPTDKRRNFVGLSDKGRALLELYLSETG